MATHFVLLYFHCNPRYCPINDNYKSTYPNQLTEQ